MGSNIRRYNRAKWNTNLIINGEAVVVGYDVNITEVVIPSSIEVDGVTYSVTSIGDYAFEYCKSLTIYCEASSKPSGWSSYWNYSNRPVYWGYKNDN